MNVAIVKYNAGNVYSVVNALRRLGIEPTLTDDAEQLKAADKVLFPGQGEASGAMAYLKARRLDELIRDLRQPVLGICIGQQLLCRHSEEGDTDCNGVFDAEVKRFQPQRHEDKVPCMGWNNLNIMDNGQWTMDNGKSPLLEGLGEKPYVYFVHNHRYGGLYPALLCIDAQGQLLRLPVPPGEEREGGRTDTAEFPSSIVIIKFKVQSSKFKVMIELIPAIDIINGQCVRLTKGDYDQKTVYGEPLDMALEFERIGYERLHVVDLDGAKSKHIVNSEVLRQITTETQLTVDFGGGIKTDEDIEKAFASGASMVTIGSIAVTQPELFMGWLERYGAEKIILGADVRHGKISINGWKEDSGEDLLPFLKKYVDAGVKNVLCTEISKDGTLAGPAIDLYKDIMAEYPQLHLIASGGVSSKEDIEALDAAGIPAVVFGKAIYEGRIDLKELVQAP